VNRHRELDSMFDALERGDYDFIRAWFERHTHPEIEFTSALTSEIEGRVYRGQNGMIEWAGDVIDAVQITYGEREFVDIGDDVVVALLQSQIEGRGSGLEMELEVGFVIEFEGDLARRGASYIGYAEALAAAEEAAARA
jgi:ketosteroid isomerase-like protein